MFLELDRQYLRHGGGVRSHCRRFVDCERVASVRNGRRNARARSMRRPEKRERRRVGVCVCVQSVYERACVCVVSEHRRDKIARQSENVSRTLIFTCIPVARRWLCVHWRARGTLGIGRISDDTTAHTFGGRQKEREREREREKHKKKTDKTR